MDHRRTSPGYSITSSARLMSLDGAVSPIAVGKKCGNGRRGGSGYHLGI
jgi:hypothetical protein